MRSGWVAVAVVMALVAGCTASSDQGIPSPTSSAESSAEGGSGAAPVRSTAPAPPPAVAKTSHERGGIRGVVVDSAIRPVANVTVKLRPEDRKVTTRADGQFTFDLLEPGTYFLEANASRYLVSQSSVVVEAGKSETVRIVLEGDGTIQPYHTTEAFKGHADFDLGAAAPDTLPMQCDCSYTIHPDLGFRTFVVEASGKTSTPRPPVENSLFKQITWTFLDKDQTHGTGYNSTDFPFTSYIPGDKFLNKTDEITMSISGTEWPDGQMDFDVYITTFYVDAAPVGWSFLAGDT